MSRPADERNATEPATRYIRKCKNTGEDCENMAASSYTAVKQEKCDITLCKDCMYSKL